MPNTPEVRFNFKNNNVQPSVPLLGVSHVVARTTKGPFNQPDQIFRTYAAFQRVYGEEVVPDGSVSNIQKAFELGSTLRISRVEGKDGAKYGKAVKMEGNQATEEDAIITIHLRSNDDSKQDIQMNLGIRTKEAGSPVLDDTGTNLNREFYLLISNKMGVDNKYYITQFSGLKPDGTPDTTTILDQSMFFQASSVETIDTNVFINPSTFIDFVNNVPNIELVFKSATSTITGIADRIKTMEDVMSTLRTYVDHFGYIEVNGQELPGSEAEDFLINEVLSITEGTNGGDSDASTWVKAYEATKAYSEAYQLICSHIHQHLPETYIQALAPIAKDVTANFETVLYVEVPKYTADGEIRTPEGIVDFMKETLPTLGYSKNVAYFAGGLKYYDQYGALQKCDVLGSVLGLGDRSATQYGPWYSFSGMNRGTLPDSIGPVTENVGAPSNIEKLKNIAEWFCNVFVIKDTTLQGKQTMLWNGFTSHIKNDSEKFLNIVRLNLYLKKTLRPILESYLEEPNIWHTWRNIYYRAAKIFGDLESRNAIVAGEWEWFGDQNASSYDDLQINNEADVRMGKYKVIFRYKEIVSMQEIEMNIEIDSVKQSVTISE